jgi:hypothetical protein
LDWLPEQLWEAIEMMKGTRRLDFVKVIYKLFFAVRSRNQSASCGTESLDAVVRSLSEYERLEANHDAFGVLGRIGKSFYTILFAQIYKAESMKAGGRSIGFACIPYAYQRVSRLLLSQTILLTVYLDSKSSVTVT